MLIVVSGVVAGSLATTAAASPESAPQSPPPIEIGEAGTAASLSGDGQRLVYLAKADDSSYDQVWLDERSTGEVLRLTLPRDGVRDGETRSPMISRDGCSVVIVTQLGYDLFRDDDIDDRWDVYRTVLPGCTGAFEAGEWQLVSTVSSAEPTARNDVAPDQAPAINGSGEIVVYARRALPGGGPAAAWTSLDAVDLTVPLGEAGRTVTAPGLPMELPTTSNSYVGQRDPVISDDGLTVAFSSDATVTVTLADVDNPEASDEVSAVWAAGPQATGPATTQVYAWTRQLGADDDSVPMRLVSARRDGSPATGSSTRPAISSLGDVIAFESVATDLLDGSATGTQIYRASFDPEFAVTLVSEREGVPGNAASTRPALDASGNLVTFVSAATNLTAVAPSHRGVGGDVLLADLGDNTIDRLTVRPDGLPATPSAGAPLVSASGRVVVFSTFNATELSAEAPTDVSGAQIAIIDRPPVLSLTNVDIGTIEVGVESPVWFTTVENLGQSSFVPGEISTPNAGVRITGGTCVVLSPLPPGEGCTITFAVTPLGAGPFAATINIRERGGPITASAIVSGAGGVKSIIAAPSGMVLAAAAVGASTEPTVVTFVNAGAFPEVISGLSRGGSHPSDLAILIDGCTARTLQPGDTCEVGVALSPSDNGPRNTILTAITGLGATASTVIDGQGVYEPGIVLDAEVIGQRRQVVLSGLGFPANAIITVGWTGSDRAIRVGTEPNGSLNVRLTPAPGMTGEQTITIVDPDLRFEPIASRPVLITADQRRRRPLAPND